MSYCVHCGVELAASEKKCPLCNTEVIDPSARSGEEILYPYPKEVQRPSVSFRRGAAIFCSIALIIPILCTLVADLAADLSFGWSLTVSASILLFFFVVLFPMLFRKPAMWLFLTLDIPMVFLYLFVLCILLDRSWWLMPGLPLTLLSGAFAVGNYLMFSAKKPSFGLKCIVLLLSAAVFACSSQIVIELYLRSVVSLSWSIYIAVSCTIMSIVILVIDCMYHFSDKIRKRIFM